MTDLPRRVTYVWDSEYPWDVRTEKVCRALRDAGIQVAITARNRTNAPAMEELPEGVVHRMRALRFLPGALNAASMFPAFFNPRWYNHILRVSRAHGSEMLVCRDLPLAPTSIMAARKLGVPVVFDMAENYPAMLQSRRSTGRLGMIGRMVRNPSAAHAIEKWTLRRIDSIMVVVEESGERLQRLGYPADRIAVVCNTPPGSRLEGPISTHVPGPLEVIYLGLLEHQRGLTTLIDSVVLLRNANVPVRLTLIGSGADESDLREQVARNGLTESVTFLGRMENREALRLLPGAHVGVVPHWKDESWDTTIPNKLFDYMACGLAVATSDAIPAARIVRESEAGRVYSDRDPASLAAALTELANPEIRQRAGDRGREAVRTRFNWEHDVERMLRLIVATRNRYDSRRTSRAGQVK